MPVSHQSRQGGALAHVRARARQAPKELLKAAWIFGPLPSKWPMEPHSSSEAFAQEPLGETVGHHRVLPTRCAQLLSLSRFQICVKNTVEKIPAIFIYGHILNQASNLYRLPRVRFSSESRLPSISSFSAHLDQ